MLNFTKFYNMDFLDIESSYFNESICKEVLSYHKNNKTPNISHITDADTLISYYIAYGKLGLVYDINGLYKSNPNIDSKDYNFLNKLYLYCAGDIIFDELLRDKLENES